MSEKFLKKKGVIVNYLASELLQLKKGDRLLSISEYQQKFDVARGTIQNALNYLKDEQAIVCTSKGHLGTFIHEIDYAILQKYAISESILGTMTLPYSRLYEGMATGLYDAFEKNKLKLNLAYIRGSKERVHSIINKTYRFAVISRFAANEAIQSGEPLEIVIEFGNYTYLSEHILLLADKEKNQIEKGMKIGIDYSSLDHQLLTKKLVDGKKVEYIEMPGHQIIHALKNGVIDAGVWNYDEIRDKDYQELNYTFLDPTNKLLDMSASVIVCHKEDTAMQAIFHKSIDKQKILAIQNQVKSGDIVPRY